MSKAIDVRQLKGTDADLASQTIRAIKREGESSEPPSLDSDGMRLWLKNSSNVLIAATEAARPVGFALGYLLDRVDEARSMLFFYEIVVASDCRRRGIGKRLVEAMKAIAREQQVSKMWVQTDPGNTAARALYQRAGGAECADLDLLVVWTDRPFSHLDTQPP
jgi:aminoglycoside 3-N-acetyltransferase I